MAWPMILLAVGSVCSGFLLAYGGALQNWLAPVVGEHHDELPVPVWTITAATLAVVLAGVAVAYRRYGRVPVPVEVPAEVSGVTVAARRDLYGDAVNEAVFMRPGARLTRTLDAVDDRGVDGAVTGIGALVVAVSARTRTLQNGFVRTYAMYMVVGAALVVATLTLVR